MRHPAPGKKGEGSPYGEPSPKPARADATANRAKPAPAEPHRARIPAAALLIGAALAALGRYAGPVALVVIVLGGLPGQLAERRADGHDLDIRRVDHLVARQERGGALLNISDQTGPRKGTGERTLERAYPYGLARLLDISADASPQQSATLGGTYASAAVIRQRLTHVTRLWVAEWTTPKPVPVLDGLGFRLIHSWDVRGLWLRLYTTRAEH